MNLNLQPIVYTTDMTGAVDWYCKVLDRVPSYASARWTSIGVGDATLGIHLTDKRSQDSNVELSLFTTEPLEEVEARLSAAGISIERGIQDEAFGRSMLLRDPDGSPIQINEHHHR